MKRDFRLKTIIFSLILFFICSFLGAFLSITYIQSKSLLEEEMMIKARYSVQSIDQLIKTKFRQMENDFINMSYLFMNTLSDNRKYFERQVVNWEDYHGHLDYDFIIFTSIKNKNCYIVSNPITELNGSCLDIAVKTPNIFSKRWEVITLNDQKIAAYFIPIENKFTGAIVAYYIGGIVLSDNTYFLNKLLQHDNLNLNKLSLLVDGKVTSTVDIDDTVTPYSELFSFASKLSPPFDKRLSVSVIMNNDSISTLENRLNQLIYYGILISIIISGIVAIYLSGIIEKELKSLLNFIVRAHKERRTHWRNTTIADFNLIGKEIISIVKNLKDNELQLVNVNSQLEASVVDKQRLLHNLITTQESERAKIAKELHDDLGQLLSAVRVNVHMLNFNDTEESNAELVRQIQHTVSDMYDTVYNRIMQLRPFELDDFGLAKAMRHISSLNQLKNMGYCIDIDIDQTIKLDPKVETHLYRIAQEALSNTMKYANGNIVQLTLEDNEDGVYMEIKDNGIGLSEKSQRTGYGMMNIKERVEYINGSLDIDGRDGTAIKIFVRGDIAYA